MFFNIAARCGALQEGTDGGNHDAARSVHQGEQCLHSVGNQILLRREGIVGQGFVIGKTQDLLPRKQKLQIVKQMVCGCRIPADNKILLFF